MSKQKKSGRGLLPMIILFLFFIMILTAVVLCYHAKDSGKSKRTIMLYGIGSNLESVHANLTFNLKQCMDATIPENVNFIVITGGSQRWFLPEDRLFDESGNPATVDPEKKQIWKLTGSSDGETGKMTLLTSLDECADKYMTDPEVLRSFIDYCYDKYPAKKFDMILWDHGYGPLGYGNDEQNYDLGDYEEAPMSLDQISKALDDSKMKQKFDLIDFDACLMSNAEVMIALSDYADNFVLSADSSPEFGQYYTNWLSALKDDPDIDGFELGKKIVDDSIGFYMDENSDGYGRPSTLAVVNSENFNKKMIIPIADFTAALREELYSGEDFDYRSRIIAANTSVKYNWDGLVDLGDFAKRCDIEEISDQINVNMSGDASQDMIYFACTDSYKGDPEHLPSGMSIFFPTKDVKNARRYMIAMETLKSYLEENGVSLESKKLEILENQIQIAAGYTVIDNTGFAVSNLAAQGNTDISYEDITAFLNEKEQPSVKEVENAEEVGSIIDMSYRQSPMEKGLTDVMERVSGYAPSDDWIEKIAEKQVTEALTLSKLSVSEMDGGHHVDVDESAAKTFDSSKGIREEFSVGAKRRVTDAETMEKSLEDYDAMLGTYYSDSHLDIISFNEKWYELVDAEGKSFLVSVIKSGQSGLVPIIIEDSYLDENGDPVPQDMAGYITINTADGAADITGLHTYYSYEEGELTPDIVETKKLFVGYRTRTTNTERLDADTVISVDKDAENYGLSFKANVDLKDMDDVSDKTLKSVKRKYFINDIYGYEQEITELF